MEILALITTALRGISILTSNPLLGGGGSIVSRETAELITMLSTLVGKGAEGMTELKQFADEIEAMAKANRAPSPAEWATLRARSDAAHESIQAAAEAIEEPEPEQPVDPEPVVPIVGPADPEEPPTE